MALLTTTLTSGCGRKIVPMPVETVHTEYVRTDTAALFHHLTTILQSGFERMSRRDSVSERIKETVVLAANGDTARHDTDRSVYHGSDTQTQQNLLIARFDSLESVLHTLKATEKADSVPRRARAHPMGANPHDRRRDRHLHPRHSPHCRTRPARPAHPPQVAISSRRHPCVTIFCPPPQGL